jgi:hypothetical protein
MAEARFRIVYKGEIAEGCELSTVKTSMAELFNTSVDKIEPLFSGKKVVIKRDLDLASASKYQQAMQGIGAVVVLEPMLEAVPDVSPQATAGLTLAPAGEEIIEHTPVSAPDIDTAAYTVAAPGEQIIEAVAVAEPAIDVSSMKLDQPGAQLTDVEPVAEPEIDISELGIGDPGEILVEHEEPQAAEIDTSAMSMSEPGETIVEAKPVKAPDIDTSRLSIEK